MVTCPLFRLAVTSVPSSGCSIRLSALLATPSWFTFHLHVLHVSNLDHKVNRGKVLGPPVHRLLVILAEPVRQAVLQVLLVDVLLRWRCWGVRSLGWLLSTPMQCRSKSYSHNRGIWSSPWWVERGDSSPRQWSRNRRSTHYCLLNIVHAHQPLDLVNVAQVWSSIKISYSLLPYFLCMGDVIFSVSPLKPLECQK